MPFTSIRRHVFACLFSLTVALMPTMSYAVTATDIGEAKERLEQLEGDAEQANETLNETFVQIDEKQAQIDELEASVADDAESLKSQVRTAYKSSGDVSALSSIVTSNTFGQMMTAISNMTQVQERNEDAIDSISDDRKTLDDEMSQLQTLKSQQEQEKEERDEKAKEAQDYYDGLNDEFRKQLGITDDASVPDDIDTGDARRDAILMLAYANLGGSYVWGGSAFKACDCSGLVLQCYAKIGISLPHSSESQARWCTKPLSQAVPGDIVWRPGHVGIYIGGGRTIEAHSPSRGIGYGTLSNFRSCGSPLD